MNCYGPLAEWYDTLTGDVPYDSFADYYEAEFARNGGEFRLILDLCCGTGTLAAIMAGRGYDMIAVDASEDMLMEAREKTTSCSPAPLFLCQDASELDLYGTVDAAYSSLDGINYIHPEALKEVFQRLHLFIRPAGLLIFDIKSPDWFRSADGDVFVDETDDVLCLWRADFDGAENALVYGMDIFSRKGNLWARSSEEHIEYAHSEAELKALLESAGFVNIDFRYDGPQSDNSRIFVIAERSR